MTRKSSTTLFAILFGIAFCLHAAPVSAGFPDLRPLEDVPIQNEGRNKPFFTLAREALVTIHGSDQFTPEKAGLRGGAPRKMSAVEVASAIWFDPTDWESERLIQVTLKPLREKLGLEETRRYFSFSELAENSKVISYLDEVRTLQNRADRPKLTREQQEASNVGNRISLALAMLQGTLFTAIPPSDNPADANKRWLTPSEASTAGLAAGGHWETLREAFIHGDDVAFRNALTTFRDDVKRGAGAAYPAEWIISLEHVYGLLHPFRWAWVAYALGAVALILSQAGRAPFGYRLGWILTLTGFALQIFGFFCRSAIAGRAPVTNMYETVIYVGFGVVLFGIILETIYKCRYFLLAAAPAAMISLYLADSSPQILDPSIQPLQPVLQDNFWLTTHVLTITLSYAAFLLALALSHIILGKALFGKSLETIRPVYQYLYRALQIGVLLLAIGVVLGAFWANYSWGRFWDWDPKETWALIALLSYLFLLHGRIAGWWGGFGLAVGSVFAFLAVLMAWYGVNFILGVGLHSYGFGTGGLGPVLGFVAVETVFVIASLIRLALGRRPGKEAPGSAAS